jgi:predicted amidohydrolase
MITRSLENRVFSVTANRTGTEARAGEKLKFTGRSQVVSPRGKVLAQADEVEETVGLVEVDVAEADDKMATPYNHVLEDRVPNLYRPLSEDN